MASFNSITIMGNVGQAPEVRTVNGEKVAQFSVATTEGKGETARTDWHRVSIWGNLADFVEKYVTKGTPVLVNGSMHYREYTDRQGVKRTACDIRGRVLQLVGSKKDGQEGAPAQSFEPQKEDLPF